MNGEDKDFEVVVGEALLMAQKAFQKHLEDYYFDPAYCDIRFTAWVKSDDFAERLKRFEIEDEVKEVKNGN